MKSWKTVSLGEACEIIKRGITPTYLEDGGICVVNQKCIRRHTINMLLTRRHNIDRKMVPPERFIRLGDVLVNSTGTGTLGRVAQVRQEPSEPTTVDTHVTIVRPYPNKFHNDFFGYMLIKIEEEIANSGEGSSGQTELSRRKLAEGFQVSYPDSIREQRRIATILDKADAVRRKRKDAIALTEDLLRSAFLEMFGDPMTNPKGWDIVSLEKTFERKPQIGATKPAHPDGKQLIVRVGEIGGRNICLESCGKITLEDKDLEKNLCRTGDFLLARAIGSESHLGKASILQNTESVVVFDSHVMRLRFSEDKLLPEVFLIWLKTKGGRVRFMREAGRTAVQFNVNAKQISRVKIPLPPVVLQREFMDVYKQLYLNLDKYERSRQSTEFLFNSLLQRAFRGDL